MSAGLWFAVSYGVNVAMGGNASLVDCAVDGGIMGACAVASDLVHSTLGMNPTGTTSAVATGALFAGAEKLYRGSDDYMVNGLLAGANDWAIEKYQTMQRQSAMHQAMAYADEE
jgi:hypothetical protein